MLLHFRSIIIVCFLHGKPYEHLIEKCKKIHVDKKASLKLCEPAFNSFDRFTSDGPFSEVAVLKAADTLHSSIETTSTSSSSSSSPVSETNEAENIIATVFEKVEIQAVFVTDDDKPAALVVDDEKHIKKIKSGSEECVSPSQTSIDPIVSSE